MYKLIDFCKCNPLNSINNWKTKTKTTAQKISVIALYLYKGIGVDS